ncbi:hypothetical protein HYH02_006265 [Chlamydomonas schloesseri]|uniref:TOG domain-containing protein n=1 Tax=Chlamydomonas schloesseri TaxID=2026947 RepID=A0A835WJU8_9CHLO|nr:hypothetical protein HYH02_006265 [Chlamydomonas schloesseri]|eukprot:KAG2448917.1 hypothetical protein HYH02_006265 [Chlamydomonas schloesseri]
MGSLFSKDKKEKAPEPRKPGSAPTRLEGLDGTSPPEPVPARRAVTPDPPGSRAKAPEASPVAVSAAADTPSPASTTSPSEATKPSVAPVAQPAPPAPAAAEEAPPSPGGNGDVASPSRRAPKKIDYVGAQSDGTKLAADLPAAVHVPDDASSWIACLGESLVRNLHSPDWKTREHALHAVTRNLGNARWNAERAPEDIWNTVSSLLDKALKDKVAPLFHAALELLSTLVASYAPQLKYSVLTQGLEPLMPTLLHRVGNNNSRIQETSIQALLTLANQPSLGLAFLAPHALSPIPKKSQQGSAAASQMSGRLELITCMLNVQVQQQLGFGTAGRVGPGGGAPPNVLSDEEVVKFARPALDMPDDKVRTAAVRVVAEVYRNRKANGQPFEVEKMLGAGVKPALLQVLHRRFAEVDEEIANGVVPGTARPGNPAEEVPVGPGITIKAPGSASGKGALPPISGRFGSLPSLAVVGSRGGSRADLGAPPGSAGDPFGKPPRTPVTPGGSTPPRGRTPPRGSRLSTANGSDGGARVASPMRGGSPARGLRGEAPLPGTLPDPEGGPDVMMIHSGTSTPVRGNSSQSVRGSTSGQGVRGSTNKTDSLKVRSKGSGVALDDAEEQLIEYILNDEVRAAS